LSFISAQSNVCIILIARQQYYKYKHVEDDRTYVTREYASDVCHTAIHETKFIFCFGFNEMYRLLLVPLNIPFISVINVGLSLSTVHHLECIIDETYLVHLLSTWGCPLRLSTPSTRRVRDYLFLTYYREAGLSPLHTETVQRLD